ncbi:hsp70 family protein [Gigaspora margarita]|uniref:Hsp70 family protein n=1 Tax=Gigaspora margarita TaxID=4874 RepID=A0A8H4B208_GIGMA|nr:hsp70 family protein [Gigaspora margarita]
MVELSCLIRNDIGIIKQICQVARYNKSIRMALTMIIMFSAEPIVNLLQYQNDCQKNGMNYDLDFLKLADLDALEQFKSSLVDIKEFVKCITQIHSSVKYKNTASIKQSFEQIIKDYRIRVKNLNLEIPITNLNEQEYLKDEEINDFIEKQSLVKNKKLNHGLIINDRGISPKYEFKAQFKISINSINQNAKNFHINLRPVKTQRDTLLKFNIEPSAIGFEHFQFISSQLTNKSVNDVYLEIKYPLLELIFEKEDIILPENLIKNIKDALESHNPYHKLMQIFTMYGHFVPKKVTLGHKLHKMSCLKGDGDLTKEEKVETNEYFGTNEFKELWYQWNKLIVNYFGNDLDCDEPYLTSMDSKIFEKKDIKDWTSRLSNNINHLHIISWDELYCLYELLDDNLKQKVKTIFGINDPTESKGVKEKVLMSGVIAIKSSSYYYVELPHKLNNGNYQIFGRLVTQDGKTINAIIKFKYMTNHSFIVFTEIDKFIKSTYSNLQIFWIMVGSPEIGFFSPNTRDVSILALGRHEFAYAKKLNISFQLPENLPINWILCASIQYLKNCPNFTLNIQYDKNNNRIIATIYNDTYICPSQYDPTINEYLFHWCILPEDHEVLTDVFKSQEILADVSPENQETSARVLLENQENDFPEKRFNLSSIGQDKMSKSNVT